MISGAQTAAATRIRNALLALVAVGLVATFVTRPATGEDPASNEDLVGQAGTDTRLPSTDSEVTVSGRGPFADLKITVNQTKELVNQAISVSWTGGKPTSIDGTRPTPGGAAFPANYLQIMQCWGEEDGTSTENPGPPPEQCVFGAMSGSGGLFPGGSYAPSRVVSSKAWPGFDPTDGIVATSGSVWKPFRAVNGDVVGEQFDSTCIEGNAACNFWLNDHYNRYTTNEIAATKTRFNGLGAELFEVATGVEQSGLGCGQKLVPFGGGEPRSPKCWLVIVPRGEAALEHEGTGLPAVGAVMTSPLAAHSWENRIAVPLEFRPLESVCDFSQDARQIAGSELAALAVSSWQPKVCATPGAAAYTFAAIGDARARQQLLGKAFGSPGMAVVSRPIDPSLVDPDDPVLYAPLSVSATVIGFNVERAPKSGPGFPASEEDIRGVRVAEINFTPRLVAKLLTQSYTAQVDINGPAPYEWSKTNPRHLAEDPDFQQFNREFSILLAPSAKNFSGLIMPAGNFDHAQRLWEYVLADPEARAWLDGEVDSWGMKVNPAYATKASSNSSAVAFGDPPPERFPKSDSHCHQAAPLIPEGSPPGTPAIIPPVICGTDWLPYSSSLQDAARRTRVGDDGAKTVLNGQALTADKIWSRDGPQKLGSRSILSLTDTASAERYGLQMAKLSRAGDNGSDRKFVAPDVQGMIAAGPAMAPRAEPQVVEPDPKSQVVGAYPLTHLTYAAITPLSLPDKERQDYAAFVEYAAGPGQDPGPRSGQLPRGYAPLSGELRFQAMVVAEFIRHGVLVRVDETPAPSGTPDSPQAAPATLAGTRPTQGQEEATPGPGTSAARAPARSNVPGIELPVPLAPQPVSVSKDPASASTNSGLATPILALARSRFTLPVLAVIALMAAWLALEISKRPRLASLSERSFSSDALEVP